MFINNNNSFGGNGVYGDGLVQGSGLDVRELPFTQNNQGLNNQGLGNTFGGVGVQPQPFTQGLGQPSPFMVDPLVGGFRDESPHIKNKTMHISNVLLMLFGEGYSFNAVKVPAEEVFPERIRHFDRTGFSYLHTQSGTYQSVGVDGVVVNVTVTYAVCQACRKVYYRIDSIF